MTELTEQNIKDIYTQKIMQYKATKLSAIIDAQVATELKAAGVTDRPDKVIETSEILVKECNVAIKFLQEALNKLPVLSKPQSGEEGE